MLVEKTDQTEAAEEIGLVGRLSPDGRSRPTFDRSPVR